MVSIFIPSTFITLSRYKIEDRRRGTYRIYRRVFKLGYGRNLDALECPKSYTERIFSYKQLIILNMRLEETP